VFGIPWEHAVPIILSVLASLVTVGQILQKVAESKRTADIQEAATVLTGYKEFVDQLQARIDRNDAEIQRLQKELRDVRTRYDEDRRRWEAEKAVLEYRVQELERENSRLRQRIEELRAAQGSCA